MNGKSLYEVLGVPKDAEQGEIKKAYHKLCLRLHPDKNPSDEEANAKFQSLQKIYHVLGDPERRKVYDATGVVDDDSLAGGEQFEDLCAYFRAIFKQVTVEEIEAFEAEYRGSEEEAADLLKLYISHSGDMGKVFDSLMLSDPAVDSHRFMDAVNAAIADGRAKSTKAFSRWAKEVEARPRPANPLAASRGKGKAKSGKGAARLEGPGSSRGAASDAGALVASIRQNRAQAADALFASLEAKYGGGGAAGGSKAGGGSGKKRKGGGSGSEAAAGEHGASSMPSEEEFAAAQERIKAKQARGAGGSSVDGGSGAAEATGKGKQGGGRKKQ